MTGFCKRKFDIAEMVEDLDEGQNLELCGFLKDCSSCNGYNYDCEGYVLNDTEAKRRGYKNDKI